MKLASALETALLTVVLASSGCVGPTFVVQHYDGPARPREAIAVVRVKGDESVRLIALDGADAQAPIDSDVRLHIEVLPGEHTLQVANAAVPSQPVQRVSFHAEPGHVYHVFFVRLPPGPGREADPVARVYQVSDDSDTPIRDVTRVRSMALPARPDAR